MAVVPTPSALDFGVPAQSSETFTRVNPALFVDATPYPSQQDYVVAFSTTILELQVVGFSGGKLVPAQQGSIQAIGVAVLPATAGAADTPAIPVYRAGAFNADALVWHASYDTDAKKLAAFDGAPTPTNILVRKVRPGA